MTPLERALLSHHGFSLALFRPLYQISLLLATQPQIVPEQLQGSLKHQRGPERPPLNARFVQPHATAELVSKRQRALIKHRNGSKHPLSSVRLVQPHSTVELVPMQ